MIRGVKRFNAPALGSPRSPPKSIKKKCFFNLILGLVFDPSWARFRRLLGVFWGLLGAQVGPSWLPKASWTRSGLQKAILQKYNVFPGKTTHSGLPEPPKTGQDRPKTGPRSSREALENKLFPCYFLESIFWRSKSEQNLIKKLSTTKIAPR